MAKIDVVIDGSGAKRGARDVVRSLDQIRERTASTDRQLSKTSKSFKGLGLAMQGLRAAAGPLAAAFGVKEIIQTTNEYQGLQNQLKVVTDSSDQLAAANERLFAISQKTRTPLEATVGLYSKASIAAKELGASQEQLYKLVETTGKALAVGGTSAAEASGSLRQLSQAFSSGIVRAEEFNSILEGAFPLAQAAAAGLDAAGGSVGKLRNLIVEGEVSSKAFFDAILKGGKELDTKFAKTTLTLGQGFTLLGNSFTKFIGRLTESTGVAGGFSKLLEGASKAVDQLGKALFDTLKPADELSEGIKLMASALILMGQAVNLALTPIKLAWQGFKTLGNAIGGVAAAMVQFAHGEFSSAADTIKAVMSDTGDSIKGSFKDAYADAVESTSGTIERLVQIWDEGSRQIAEVQKQTQEDTGGGSGPEVDEKALKAAEKRAQALRDQAEALKQAVDPMYVYEQELDKINTLLIEGLVSQEQADAAIVQAGEAYNAANPEIQKYLEQLEAAKSLTEEVRTPQEQYTQSVMDYIDLLNSGLITQETFGRAVEDANQKMIDAMDKSKETSTQLSEFAKQGARNIQTAFADFLFDPFDGGVKGMVSGFAEALKRMAAEALSQTILTGILNAFAPGAGAAAGAGGGGGGILAALAGGFAGRANGGPLQEGQASIVGERGKPEVFIPKTDGTVVPMEKMGGQAPNVEVPVNITNVTDPKATVAAIESGQGQKAILNVISSNPDAIKRALS